MKEGDKFPSFSLEDQDGKLVSKLTGWTVIYFYPKDSTPGCTIEAIDFTKQLDAFKTLGVHIIGVSTDNKESHCKFIAKQSLKIQLLSDPEHKLMDSLGVWRPKKFMGREFLGTVRSTFLVDPKGVIRALWESVSVSGHVDEVLEKAKELTAK